MSGPLPPAARNTQRFALRPFRRRDAASVHSAVQASLPELAEWLPWAARNYSRAVTQNFIRDSIGSWNDNKAFDFAIRRHEEPDRHVGNVSLWWVSRINRVGEIGYWVRSDETSTGICTEVTARVLEVAFYEMGLHRAVLRIAVGNRASERVAEKLGFRLEGTLRDEVRVGNKWLDHTIWGLLDREWVVERDRYRAESWI
jgi:ribosomal-protein-serine acetyltransferase